MKRILLFILSIAAIGIVGYFAFYQKPLSYGSDFSGGEKRITIVEDGLVQPMRVIGARTAGDVLKKAGISANGDDEVFPFPESEVFSGAVISIKHSRTATLSVGGKSEQIETTTASAEELFRERRVVLGADDFALPSLYSALSENAEVEVVRVKVEEKSEFFPIDFKTRVKEDDELGWRVKKTEQKGKKGEKEERYKVVSHNGEVVKKTLLGEKITEEPTEEVVIQGTFVKLGKSHTGAATWYAHTGTLAAASPWLPLGSYAKVTNRENGRSVMVVINDRGPFGKGRIIDLDKVAFQKIASIGAGVIGVKVEEVIN